MFDQNLVKNGGKQQKEEKAIHHSIMTVIISDVFDIVIV